VAHDRKAIGNPPTFSREIHIGERQIVITVLLIGLFEFGRRLPDATLTFEGLEGVS
jgi:hypothetical protein